MVCPHCGDELTTYGDTVVACVCAGSRQYEIEEKYRRQAWVKNYDEETRKYKEQERKERDLARTNRKR